MGIPPADEGPNPELVDFTRRLWVSAILALPLLALGMGPMLGLPLREAIGEPQATYIELLLATPVVLWAALPFFRRAWASLVNRSPNMWTLIGLGVGTAYLYSLFRGGRRHRRARLRRPGAGIEGARTHRLGDPRPA
jgi:Cu+-exporting ATPase